VRPCCWKERPGIARQWVEHWAVMCCLQLTTRTARAPMQSSIETLVYLPPAAVAPARPLHAPKQSTAPPLLAGARCAPPRHAAKKEWKQFHVSCARWAVMCTAPRPPAATQQHHCKPLNCPSPSPACSPWILSCRPALHQAAAPAQLQGTRRGTTHFSNCGNPMHCAPQCVAK